MTFAPGAPALAAELRAAATKAEDLEQRIGELEDEVDSLNDHIDGLEAQLAQDAPILEEEGPVEVDTEPLLRGKGAGVIETHMTADRPATVEVQLVHWRRLERLEELAREWVRLGMPRGGISAAGMAIERMLKGPE